MRRLWAYIIIAFTSIVAMGTTFPTIFKGMRSNIEYQDGRELVFRISDKEDEELELPEDGSAVDNIAAVMEERLEGFGISRYEIAKEGVDTVKVTFSASNADLYSKAQTLLSFNGSLALTTSGTDVALGSEFLLEGKDAYLDDINGYPTVVIPVNTENSQFKAVIEAVKKQQEELDGQSSDSEEGEAKAAYLYLWQDFVEGEDTFSKTQQTLEDGKENPDYDENVAKKIVMSFAANNLWYPDEKEDKLAAAINVNGADTGSVTTTDVKNAYDDARYYVQLINCGEIDYDVEFMYSRTVEAWVENLIENGSIHQTLAWSRTLISVICAIVIISLLLVVFYKIGALSVITSTLITAFAAVSFIVLFAAEFNTMAIIGVCLVAVASLTSGVVYLNKLKEEAYKGRSLKKANSEAAKKSFLPIIDINIVAIVLGAITYLLGGVIMKSFSAALVLGGLASLVVNLILLRIMMWLATNATSLTGKYNLFGIEPEKVLNILNEEKQSYFGPFADRDFTKKKKPIGIVSLVLTVASIAGIITFGSLNNGEIYNNGGIKYENSQIFVETTSDYSPINSSYLLTFTENVFIYDEADDESRVAATKLSDLVITINDEKMEEVVNGATITNYYYVIDLNTSLKTSTYAYYKEVDENDAVIYSLGDTGAYQSINELLANVFDGKNIDEKATIDLKEVTVVSKEQPPFGQIALATAIAIVVLGVYFSLRYRLSRGIATALIALSAGLVTFGIFVLTRVPVISYVTGAVPFVVAFTLIVSILFLNKEREMILEDKTRDSSLENRNAIMSKANSIAFGPIVVALVLALYLVINFYGFGPISTAVIYTASAIGILLATLFVSTLLGPTSQMFYKWFRKSNIKVKPRKNKKVKVARKKSAEPEEAVFIGIND